MRTSHLALTLLLQLLCAGASLAQSDTTRTARDTMPRGRFVLTGKVASVDSQPLANAQVRWFGSDLVAITDSAGGFRLSGLPSGSHGFEISALGFFPQRIRADIGDRTKPVTVLLARGVATLESVHTVATRPDIGDEFEQRRRGPTARFVTSDDIAKRQAFMVSDVLQMMGGFTSAVGKDGNTVFGANRGVVTLRGLITPNGPPGSAEGSLDGPTGTSNRGAGRLFGTNCPRVYVNGMEDPSGNVNRISASAIRGIEVYRTGEAPAKYDAFCGLVLIWTM